jgi:peptidoglycan/LPS O-acetylase OafA/YrhL
MSSKLPSGQHMPQLDGLRTLAVAAVIWSHWAPPYQFGFEWGHNLTVYGLVFAVKNLHVPEAILTVAWIRCLGLLVLTISAAAVSWHFFEKPLNDLKRFFLYTAPARARQRVVEAKI